MPVVPYNPVPDAVGHSSTPGIRLDTPGAAFGTAVADSLSHIGKVSSQLGDEIYSRAKALQDLNNDAEAKQADSEYMIRLGELHADYSSKEGKERVDAFPQYMRDIEAVRVEIGGRLSNGMARKIYDGSTRGQAARTIFNGAGQAASAQRQYVTSSAVAQMDLDAKSVEDNPGDERTFQAKLQRTRENARLVSLTAGNPEGSVQEQALEQKAVSKLYADRIAGLARTAPFLAAQMLDANKTNMTQQDYNRVMVTVRNEGRAVGSAQLSDEIFTDGMANGLPLADMEARVRERAKKIAPDDPVLANQAVAALRSRWNQNNYATKQERIENNAIVNTAILEGPKDERQLRLNPRVAKAIDALPPEDQLSIPGRINRYNTARDKVTNQEEYNRLYGLAINDREAFLSTDMTKEKLSQSDMRAFQKMQEKMKSKALEDPRVPRAIGWMRSAMGAQMQELGVYTRDPNNPELYDKLAGATQLALDTWMQAKGKPPTDKEFIEQIAPQILYQRQESSWFFFTKRRGFFDQDIPKNFSEQLKEDFKSRGLTEPSAAQIDRAYTGMLMRDLFGKKQEKPSVPKQ